MYNNDTYKEGYKMAMNDFDTLADEILGASDNDIYCSYIIREILEKMEEKLLTK